MAFIGKARCKVCGLFGCVHCEYSSPFKYNLKKSDSEEYANLSDYKKLVARQVDAKLLQELYAASDKAATTYVQCDICRARVSSVYLNDHMKVHGAVPPVDDDEKPLTVEESLSKITKACEGCQGDEACCAIAGLKAAGWDVQINPAMAYGDRKGYQITILEPKKEESNVQPAKEK